MKVYVVKVQIGKKKVTSKCYYSGLMSKQAAIITTLVDLHLTAVDLEKPLTITIKEMPIPSSSLKAGKK